MPELTDTHAHLDYYDPRKVTKVIDRAAENNVTRVITIADSLRASYRAVELTESFPGKVFAAVGVHPHEAKTFESSTLQELRRLAGQPGVVAIGETGLDFYYTHSPKETQKKVFLEQLRLARNLDLPVIIHARQAHADLFPLIPTDAEIRGVFHCFSEDEPMARQVIDLGFYISVTGILTFKKAKDLVEVIESVPLDRLLLETDSPYLAPHPFRGQDNEPAYLPYIARKVAEIRQLSLDAVSKITQENTERLFRLNKSQA